MELFGQKLAVKYNRKRLGLKLAPYQTAAETIGEITPDFAMSGLTKGQFSLIDMIEHISEQLRDCEIEAVTWNIGIADCDQIEQLIDLNYIKSFVLITDLSTVARKSSNIESYIKLIGEENIYLTKVHAKICLIKSNSYCIVIRSSMNLNKNNRCEQFDIDNNKELYQFYKEALDDLKTNNGLKDQVSKHRIKFATAWDDDVTTINDADEIW
jgi:hypothetical protein